MTATASRRAPAVASFTGDVAAEALGVTLIHEHVFVSDPELERALPHPEWDEEGAIDTAGRASTRSTIGACAPSWI